MSFPSIGGVAAITMHGYEGLVMVNALREISRPGVDGVAFQDVAKKSHPMTVMTEVDATSATSFESGCHALEKTFVTVVTPLGKSIPKVLVLRAEVSGHAILKSVGGNCGGSGAYWMTCRWHLQATDPS